MIIRVIRAKKRKEENYDKERDSKVYCSAHRLDSIGDTDGPRRHELYGHLGGFRGINALRINRGEQNVHLYFFIFFVPFPLVNQKTFVYLQQEPKIIRDY